MGRVWPEDRFDAGEVGMKRVLADIDLTLLSEFAYTDQSDVPFNPAVLAHLRKRVADGWSVVLWTAGGQEYAELWRNRLMQREGVPVEAAFGKEQEDRVVALGGITEVLDDDPRWLIHATTLWPGAALYLSTGRELFRMEVEE